MATNSEYHQILLRLLCSEITGFTGDALAKSFQKSVVTLASTISCTYTSDEFALAERIKKKLVRQRSEKEAVYFADLYRKLQACDAVQNRWSVLYLLLRLTDSAAASKTFPTFTGASGDCLTTSTPHPGIPLIHQAPPSHLSTIHPSQDSHYLPSLLSSRIKGESSNNALQHHHQQLQQQHQQQHTSNAHSSTTSGTQSFLPPKSSSLASKRPDKYYTAYDDRGLLRDVLYAMQAVEGCQIKLHASQKFFRVPHEVDIPAPVKRLSNRLCEVGFLFARVRDFVACRANDQSVGLVCQSLCSSLQDELTEYYRVMALIEAQLKQDALRDTETVTLRRIEVSMQASKAKMQTLAALVDACSGKKGGELASVVYQFRQHGDPLVQEVTTRTLHRVCQPIFQMVADWIYKGQLENSHHEFLVLEDVTVPEDRMWHDKYSIRKSQLPSFITHEQANKILLTGKSIHFLRTTCGDRTVMMEKPEVQAAHTDQVDTIFRQDDDCRFSRMIDVTYKHTSSYLLRVLYNEYKLMQHFKAMRKYILLGQGDFIRHLMDLLEEDLGKAAQSLFLHNLTGILETAIRATNAQYEEQQIISRLDVFLLQISPGDTGWDVFSLRYHVTGHVGVVFGGGDCMLLYRMVFNFLWRAKRMEYVLVSLWKLNVFYSKALRRYAEFSSLMHSCHLLASEMMHLVQQIQYYINFEVLECSWVEFMAQLQESCDLDQLMQAHQHFINTIFSHSLLHSESAPILTQLRSLFDLILQFQDLQKELYGEIAREVELRKGHEARKKKNKGEDDDEAALDAEEGRRASFLEAFLPSSLSRVRVLSQSYKRMVEQFLHLVGAFSNSSLRCLIFRLNFSEHYRHHHTTTRKSKLFLAASASPPTAQKQKLLDSTRSSH